MPLITLYRINWCYSSISSRNAKRLVTNCEQNFWRLCKERSTNSTSLVRANNYWIIDWCSLNRWNRCLSSNECSNGCIWMTSGSLMDIRLWMLMVSGRDWSSSNNTRCSDEEWGWVDGLDYLSIDGSVQSGKRDAVQTAFNNRANLRARYVIFHIDYRRTVGWCILPIPDWC